MRERERKKDLGEKVRVRAWGRRNRRPNRNKKARGPLWPKTNTSNKNEPNRRGSEPLRPRRACYPLPSLRQGERARPPAGPPACKQVKGPLETCEAAKREKQHTRNEQTPLPPSVQEKGLRAVPRESKNRTGPRMAPRRNTRTKRTHGQNRRNKTSGGEKTRKATASAGGVWCPVRPELCLFRKKEKEERQNTRRRQPRA